MIGQQLSLAAAAAILTRLEALHGGRMPTPAQLLATDAETLRGIGMSYAKARYLHDLAARLEDGRLDLDRLRSLDDEAARDALTEVKGVGRFTADGVLVLALRRPDVWPAADLAPDSNRGPLQYEERARGMTAGRIRFSPANTPMPLSCADLSGGVRGG